MAWSWSGADSRTIADRRRLSFVGVVTVALALTEKGVLAADPEVELLGIPERGRDGKVLAEVAMDAVEDTFESLPKQRRRDPDGVAEAVKRGGAQRDRPAMGQETDLLRPRSHGIVAS